MGYLQNAGLVSGFIFFLIILALIIRTSVRLIRLMLRWIEAKLQATEEKTLILGAIAKDLNAVAAVVASYSKQIDAETDKIKKAKDYKLINNKKVDLLS